MLIPTSKNTKTVTDLRENTINLLRDADQQGHLYIFQRSNPKAVLMSMREFERINHLLEDRKDERDAFQLGKEPRGKGIPLKTVMKKYSKNE